MRTLAVRTAQVSYRVSVGKKCCPHQCMGMVLLGDPSVKSDGLGFGRFLDDVILFGPHIKIAKIIATGFPTANGRRLARVGDMIMAPGVIGRIISSPSHIKTD